MVKVKICGITNAVDARQALDCGADALGFVFAESPRKVSVDQASSIIRSLESQVVVVGVFVNESAFRIKKIAKICALSAVQLHGNEAPGLIEKLRPLKVIKAFRVCSKRDLPKSKIYSADAFLIDTKVEGRLGGTGKTFDWTILSHFKSDRPIILSGGLQPTNVRRAVRVARPYAVDVSSGVEKFPGKKDPRKVREFILNAKKS